LQQNGFSANEPGKSGPDAILSLRFPVRQGKLRTTRCGRRIDTFPRRSRLLYFSGEAIYAGFDIGAVEAALQERN
jgi:hypothetical protein